MLDFVKVSVDQLLFVYVLRTAANDDFALVNIVEIAKIVSCLRRR